MRILGIGECGDLAAMYLGMQDRGHEVRMSISDEASTGIYSGMLTRTIDWRKELAWIKEAGSEGLIIFETSDQGDVQDQLRKEGYQVIGGSTMGDRLEADREYGQSVLRGAGLRTAESHSFTSFQAAVDFLARHRKRFVLKFNGVGSARTRNYIAQKNDGSDLAALLEFHRANEQKAPAPDFVLMEFIEGIEIGVGGYFNGVRFLETACIDFEHKRFFPGDLGELTGEMGTVVTYDGSAKLRKLVLEPLEPVLREGGYCGYINVNLIANEHGLWPLEFTSRFGYPGFAICEALHAETWETIFLAMLRRSSHCFATSPGFAVGVVLSVPPFPYTHGYEMLSKGLPVILDEQLSPTERASIAYAEVEKRDGMIVTSGTSGYVGVATACAATIKGARERALSVVRRVYVPNLRYRTDIGDRVSEDVLARLRDWNFYDAIPEKDAAA